MLICIMSLWLLSVLEVFLNLLVSLESKQSDVSLCLRRTEDKGLLLAQGPLMITSGTPPSLSTELPTGTSFANLVASRDEGVYFGGLDLKDYFYHLSLPAELRHISPSPRSS